MRAASDSQGWGSAHHAIALDFASAKRSGGRSGDPKGPAKAAAECSEVLGTGCTSTLYWYSTASFRGLSPQTSMPLKHASPVWSAGSLFFLSRPPTHRTVVRRSCLIPKGIGYYLSTGVMAYA